MKIFISWSGSRSKALANALRDWLPLVLQYAKPWVSDKDISAGDRWAQSIAGELETSNFGIICITPENLGSEWVLFEAGALSKSMLDAKVIPLLFGLELSDLSGPLSQFQAQKAEEAGIMEIIRAINKVSDGKTSEDIVNRLVPQLWPALQADLQRIPDTRPSEKHMRPQHEILEELVTGVRGLNSRMAAFESSNPVDIDKRANRRGRVVFHPHIFEELCRTQCEKDDPPISLLLLAGVLRDELPWLAELLAESYREIRDGGPEEAERVSDRLTRSVRHITRGSMRELMMMRGGSKEVMFMMHEFPTFLDMALQNVVDRSRAAKSVEDETREN